MKSREIFPVAVVLSLGVASLAHANAILTDEIYHDSGYAGGASSNNDSSITVPTSDLIYGQLPSASHYTANYNATGGTLAVLTDGQTASSPSNFGSAALNPSEYTNASNSAFDLGTDWYAVYNLGAPTAIGSVMVTTGHTDNRVNQNYDILVSDDGTTFTSLSDGSTQSLGNGGGGFTYSPSVGPNYDGGAAQSTVVNGNGSPVLAVAQYVEFVETGGGNGIYRELDVNAVPEPASLSLVGIGAAGLLRRRRRS